MACAHHIDDRLASFRESGFEPILLTSLCVPKWEDYTHYRVASLFPSGLRFELRRFFRRKGEKCLLWKFRNVLLFPLLPFYGLERLFIRIDTIWYWFPLAYVWAKWICRKHTIDLVYSTGGPAVAHSVADRLIFFLRKENKKSNRIKWLAEVQDPLIHGYCANTNQELQRLRKVESQACGHADGMIFLTDKAMEATRERTGRIGNGAVVYPGAHPVIDYKQKTP
ncbi:MAG: hypothetical protein D3924_09940 [Candidatus Electrothrix sp. AR4]|nr:hypothetical protein [Candidatus Electrothrix sp. AR4]